MSNTVKSRFAGMLRGLLRRFDDTGTRTVAPSPAAAAATLPRVNLPVAAPATPPRAVFTPPPGANAGGLQLPLPAVIAVLPIDLRAKLLETPPADAFVSIPVEKVLSQLAHGAVKISFGELRAARPGLFADSNSENDARQITLPLNEIITRISPTLLSRRPVKKVEASDEIAGPFGARMPGGNFTPPPTTAKTGPTPPTMACGSAPGPAAEKSVTPQTTFVPRTAIAASHPVRMASAPAAAKSAPVKFEPATPAVAAAAMIPFSPAPAAANGGGAKSASQFPLESSILAPLSALAEKWPESIKRELLGAELMHAQAVLPVELVEPGLKRGRVTILWKNLRTMLRPNPAPVSIHDGVELELPLKVLAPLCFTRLKAGQTRHKVAVSEEIPDLFLGSPPAKPAVSSTPIPASALKPASLPHIPVAPAAPAVVAPARAVSPAPPVVPPVPITAEGETISAPLAALSEKWPEALRQEIARWNLPNAQVALPVNALAPAMKRGRVTFGWRDLRPWIQPAPAATESLFDSVELELPLKVIAPIFLERQAPSGRQQSHFAVDQSIPSPFSGHALAELKIPAPAPAPAAEPAPKAARPALKPVDAKISETNYYVWADTNDTPKVDESEYKRSQAPSTDFTSRYAAPKDIVASAMELPGVAGVVIALCDGLRIASEVPSELNADTAAAFLPQIFDRVAQCTRELRMGALNNLRFTVGNVPWHIFHVNAIYFAAFGRSGESLPTAELAALAGKLDRKKQ